MSSTTTRERELLRDLATLDERLTDEEFCTELYRALANRTWLKEGGDGHGVTMSWGHAEEVVNELRSQVDRERLELAQTGREGELSDLVRDELGRLGWRSVQKDTSIHSDEQLDREESPPGRGSRGGG